MPIPCRVRRDESHSMAFMHKFRGILVSSVFDLTSSAGFMAMTSSTELWMALSRNQINDGIDA